MLPCRPGPDQWKVTHAGRGAAVWCHHVRWELGHLVSVLQVSRPGSLGL